MKKSLLICFCIAGSALAQHDHVEIGVNPGNTNQLGIFSPSLQWAVYVPSREAFSGYATNFPGGCFASELTSTTETEVLNPAPKADPEIELVSVIGPNEGSFSFWEAESIEPTWTRPTGWIRTETDKPSFPVILDGYPHAHGRIFSANRPGDYQITFRAKDKNSIFQSSTNHTITFRAVKPPPLSIQAQTNQAVLSFLGRVGFVYDFQFSTNLATGIWSNLAKQDGPSTNNPTAANQLVLPLSHPRAFFRIVEYIGFINTNAVP